MNLAWPVLYRLGERVDLHAELTLNFLLQDSVLCNAAGWGSWVGERWSRRGAEGVWDGTVGRNCLAGRTEETVLSVEMWCLHTPNTDRSLGSQPDNYLCLMPGVL